MEKEELKKLISKVSIDIQKDWNMGGLAGGLYEDYAVEIIDRILPTLLDKAREEGKREQAELDRALYSVSFEHIKNADFEKILLESVDKAKEKVIKDLIEKIEEAHCDSISLELLKEMDLSKLK